MGTARGSAARLRAGVSAARRSARRHRAARAGGTVPGLLSIVVPVYNVEEYLDECLTSLRRQAWREVEIIVVDDGSPDGSLAIARRHRAEDGRVRILRRPNGGLSAARNTGVDAAVGEFLAFVDSDDTVTAEGYARAITTLRETGSDFAVMAYQRVKRARIDRAAPWIRAAHRFDRFGVALPDAVDVLCNSMVCSKVFRTEFWRQTGLRFIEGITYEDQQVTAEAYARAKSFDVHRTILYNWRMRSEPTSITQSRRTEEGALAGAAAQIDALEASQRVLARHSGEEVALARLLQVLANDIPQFLRRIPSTGEDYWRLLADRLPRVLETVPAELYATRVPAEQKLLHACLRADDRPAAIALIQREQTRTAPFTVVRERDALYACMPGWEERAQRGLPDAAFRLSDAETAVRAGVRTMRLLSPRTMVLEGWALIANLDLAENEHTVSARAVAPGRSPVELRASTFAADWIDEVRVPGSPWCDYRNGGLRLEVDLAALAPATWTVEVTVASGGLERSALLDRRDADLSLRSPWCLDAGAGRVAAVVADKEQPFRVTVTEPAAVVLDAELRGGGAQVRLRTAGRGRRHVSLVGQNGALRLAAASVADAGDGPATLDFDLPSGSPRRFRAVVAIGGKDEAAMLGAWHGGDDDGQRLLGTLMAPPGAAVVRTDRTVAVARAVRLTRDGLEVTVSLDIEGRAAVERERHGLHPRLRSNVASSTGVLEESSEGVVLRVPWTRLDPDGRRRPLPSAGRYLLEVVDSAGVVVCPVLVPRRLAAELPRDELFDDELRVSARVAVVDDRPALAVAVRPPLRPDERGDRNLARLRALANNGSGAAPAVFFRTLSGEATNDSALEIQRELQRRGSPLSFWWSIRDRSVPVPDGATGLVEQSEAWHTALGEASYVVVNIHQPEWYRRPASQRIVQTFHGYPYKRMGLTHWQAMDLPPATIASYHDRARDWTHLVSPSAYATPLLLAEFLPPGEAVGLDVVEAGYPRNDALLAEDRGDRARDVRRALGLPEDAFVVLYAPTFRDALSLDGRSAQRSDFFDPEELVERLGPRTWVLMRGHAFHARNRERAVEGRQVLDVTYYPDVTDLILASDAGVLDYSSLRFDYALTRKPMVFLVPDEREYHALRPGLLPYDATSPGPHVHDTAQLAAALSDPEALRARYGQAVETFIATYMEKEDGHAASRVVDAVMKIVHVS